MKILITGPEGQIGWELCRALPVAWQVMAVDRRRMDLADPAMIQQTIRDLKPDVILNAAAYTAVDKAETEPELAAAVNAEAVGIIGQEAKRIGAAVVHYSTDYVFDGCKSTPYQPDDAANPMSVYGRTKHQGEQALLKSGAAALILRTSWVYGLRGRNFLLAILRKAMREPELRVVNDQTGCPTSCGDIAKATVRIVEGALRGEPGNWSFGGKEGVYHLVSAGATTWFDFARAALELAHIHPCPRLVAISTAEFGAPAHRPAYSVLDCSRTQAAFNVGIGDWHAGLKEVLREGAAGNPAA